MYIVDGNEENNSTIGKLRLRSFSVPSPIFERGKYNELLVVLNFMHFGGVEVDDHNRILKQKKIEQENRRFMKPNSRNYMNW